LKNDNGVAIGNNKKFYVGGELNLNLTHDSTYQTTYDAGASFIPGIKLSPNTMIYGRFGLDAAYAPHKIDNINISAQYGLGLQTALTDHWDARGEYVYSNARQVGQYNLGFAYKF
jgi:outer membrane autotransporter protein